MHQQRQQGQDLQLQTGQKYKIFLILAVDTLSDNNNIIKLKSPEEDVYQISSTEEGGSERV